MPVSAAFDVMVGPAPSNGGKSALVTVTKFDHHAGTILVNNPVSNGNPNNVTFVTQVFNPDGKGATGDAHPLDVSFRTAGGSFKETINNSDFTTAPIGAHFNVLVFSS